MLFCSFYLLSLLALSPHICRAAYNVFQTEKLCSFSPASLALIGARPAACGSYSPSGSPRRWSRLLPDAQSWAHLHSAGCSIKCYPRNYGVSTIVLVVLSCSRNSSFLRVPSFCHAHAGRDNQTLLGAGRSPKHYGPRTKNQRVLPSILCAAGAPLPLGRRKSYWLVSPGGGGGVGLGFFQPASLPKCSVVSHVR